MVKSNIVRFKLIDVEKEVKEDVEFGTCELCFYTGDAVFETLVFEDSNGVEYKFPNNYWSYGEVEHEYFINYVKFADFIRDVYIDIELMEKLAFVDWKKIRYEGDRNREIITQVMEYYRYLAYRLNDDCIRDFLGE